MDNPGTSLFQCTDIQINNSQNNEEDEDLEDQMRRREELQNLLTVALDDFKYDDSTINSSSNVSLISDVQQNYKNASTPNDQLQVLYDVRVREIQNLREDFEKYKTETKKEIDLLKNTLTLSKAELRQVQISLQNSESLLVEKTDVINKLTQELHGKNNQIIDYEKTTENYKIEVATYQSQLNELHLKLQSFNGPFNLNAKYNSEELQANYKNKISQLETKIEQEVEKSKLLERENNSLKHELELLITEKDEIKNESENIMMSITKTLDNAQQQCKDLINVIEMLRRENEHFKERLKDFENNTMIDVEDLKRKGNQDNETLIIHQEKFKKMLLDKSIEIETLKTKLKYYEEDLKELIEYRQIACDVYKKEFNHCDNSSHTKDLLIMQNDLQNYRRAIDDKNQQILNLNSINKELQEKIEEMILQTRTEIHNLSQKYNVPQLQVMSSELKSAENKIEQLSQELQKSEERRFSLIKKLEVNNELELNNKLQSTNEQITEVKNMFENEKKYSKNLLNEIHALQCELEQLKHVKSDLETENLKLKNDLLNSSSNKHNQHKYAEWNTLKREYEQLKEQLKLVMNHLAKTKEEREVPVIVLNLKSSMNEFLNSLNDSNNDKRRLEDKINSWINQLDNIDVDKYLKEQFKEAVIKLHETEKQLKLLQETVEKITKSNTLIEGEKKSLLNQLKQFEENLGQYKTEVLSLNQELQRKADIILKTESNVKSLNLQIQELKTTFSRTENNLEISEQNNKELKELIKCLQKEVETLKNKNLQLQNDVTEAGDGAVKRCLEKDLKDAVYDLEQSRSENIADGIDSEYFKKCLQTEMVKCELKLRDEIQIEYQKRIQDIEQRYQSACNESNDINKLQREKLEKQENRYREHFKVILEECDSRLNKVTEEKHGLIREIENLHKEFEEYKTMVANNEHKYVKLVTNIESEAEKNIVAWKKWSEQFVSSCLDVEKTNKKSRDKILINIGAADLEVAKIEEHYNAKILKYIKKKQSK